MQIYSQLVPLALGNANGSAVAMGFFDGIHIGHRAVIEGAVQWARAHGASPAVFTFKLPTENKMKGKRLLSTEDKHALIERLGVEHYLCPDFEEIHKQLHERKNMTLVYLWNRYMKTCEAEGRKGYQYRQFCKQYSRWCETNK